MLWLCALAAALVAAAAQASNCTGSAPLTNTVSIVVVPTVLTLDARLTLNTPACGAFTADLAINGFSVLSAVPVDPK